MCIIDCLSTIVFILPLYLDDTKVIILILWWRNFQLEYWRTFQLVSTIRRDFLIENFKNAYGSNAIADMLLEFAGKHMPERLADIENGHNEVYEKRHQRIEEKKAVLLVQEQAKQEAEQTEADADNEKQPQSQEVAA